MASTPAIRDVLRKRAAREQAGETADAATLLEEDEKMLVALEWGVTRNRTFAALAMPGCGLNSRLEWALQLGPFAPGKLVDAVSWGRLGAAPWVRHLAGPQQRAQLLRAGREPLGCDAQLAAVKRSMPLVGELQAPVDGAAICARARRRPLTCPSSAESLACFRALLYSLLVAGARARRCPLGRWPA
jgi:hypothetical protein